ncbi:MAG: AraC family transcriptional regulator [Hungatella sp.]|nr:AraC family transcriptional regulator [Hungatella sp.]
MAEKTEGTFWEKSDQQLENGYHVKFVTMRHNSPFHWHRAMELLFILNGKATVTMEGKKYRLKPLEFMVMDSAQVHDTVYAMPQTMGVCIHISKNYMRRYLPDIELMRFQCSLDSILPPQKESYTRLCELIKELTILYFRQTPSYQLRSKAVVLQILAELVEHFGNSVSESLSVSGLHKLTQLEQISQFVEEHHQEKITLQDGADELGLNKDYFCRFFKENMGISFIQYVNQVRVNHIYQDLLHTDGSIQEIMEHHGFFNQKLFYRMFKEIYDCTPVKLRQNAVDNPYV